MTSDKDSFQVQRLEVVNTGRRRRWSLDEKLRIVGESFQGHRQVSATARRHDISPSLLFCWRKSYREDCRGRDEVIGFAPALIVPDEEAPLGTAAAVGRMEIVTVTGQRIMVGADVDAAALARVVATLEARAACAQPELCLVRQAWRTARKRHSPGCGGSVMTWG